VPPADLLRADEALHGEADALLERFDLLPLLTDFGELWIGGSYATRLMTWRDLDLYLRAPSLPVSRFLDLGRRLGERLTPRKLNFTNHRDFPATEPLSGLYWGLHLGDSRAGAWKLDVWALEDDAWTAQRRQAEQFASSLDEAKRQTILELKTALWNHPRYRKDVTSDDVYRAVTAGHVATLKDFWDWHGAEKGPR
jgi:hypothetical protein